jgi:hypothetical protein
MDIREGNDDREDFERFLAEYGFSKEWLRPLVENEADMPAAFGRSSNYSEYV